MGGRLTKLWQTATNILGATTVPVSGTWDTRIVTDVFSRMPSPVRTVIDVGAHTGEFALAVSNALPDAHVLCFEPLVACQALLRKNAAKLAHCEVSDCALGDANETTIMHCNAFTPCSSLLPMLPLHTRAFPQSFSVRTERVKVRRLDDVLRGRILEPNVFLKIDVQGYEDRVFSGAAETLKSVQGILVETTLTALYEKQLLLPQITKLLEQHGFRHAGDYGDIRHMLTGEVLQRDTLFLRA